MLDQEIKQAYKKITPSSELEHRILTMQVQPRKQQSRILALKPLMTIAACLVLLMGSVLVTSYWRMAGTTDILLSDGTSVNKRSVQFMPEVVDYMPSAMPRTASAEPAAYSIAQDGIAIDLHISSKKEVFLTVEEGILYVISNEDGEEIARDVGQSLTEESNGNPIAVRWVIPTSENDAEYCMTVGQKEIIRVTYHAQMNECFISRTNAET